MKGRIDLADKGQSLHDHGPLDHAHLEGFIELDTHDAAHACLVGRGGSFCCKSALRQPSTHSRWLGVLQIKITQGKVVHHKLWHVEGGGVAGDTSGGRLEQRGPGVVVELLARLG